MSWKEKKKIVEDENWSRIGTKNIETHNSKVLVKIVPAFSQVFVFNLCSKLHPNFNIIMLILGEKGEKKKHAPDIKGPMFKVR